MRRRHGGTGLHSLSTCGNDATARCRELFPRCASCGNAGPVQAVALRLKINRAHGTAPARGAPGPRTARTPADLARGTRRAPFNRVFRAPPVPLSGPIAKRPSPAPQNHAGLLRYIRNVQPRTPFRATGGLPTCGFANGEHTVLGGRRFVVVNLHGFEMASG